MSYVDLCVYVGAYLEITKLPAGVEQETTQEVWNRPNCKVKCGREFNPALYTPKYKFCPVCGGEMHLDLEKSVEKATWDMADVSDTWDTFFNWVNGYGDNAGSLDRILVPVDNGKWGKGINDDDCYELKIPSAPGFKEAFLKKFKIQLEEMKDHGVGYVVKEGIVVFDLG